MPTPEAPVFYDPKGRRWRRVRRTWLSLAVVVTSLAAIFVVSVLVNPLQTTAIVPGKRPAQMKVAPPLQINPPTLPAAVASSTKPLSIGFYVNWDDSSYASLKRNLVQLDWVVPEWIRLQDGPDPLVRDIDPRALDLIRRERPATPNIPLEQK